MRTATLIETISAQAKIVFSARMQDYEADKRKGIQKEDYNLFLAASNAFFALDKPILTTGQKDGIVDWLITNGFYYNADYMFFSQTGYDEPGYDAM